MARTYTLNTERLHLAALTYDELELLIKGDRATIATQRGIHIPATWPQQDLLGALPLITAAMRELADDERWVWIIVDPHATMLIGDIGFHQPMTAGGTVEIGYAIVPTHRGHGYASEATKALIDWGLLQPEVTRVIAKIAPTNAASLRVAEKVGMSAMPSDEPDYLCFAISRSSDSHA